MLRPTSRLPSSLTPPFSPPGVYSADLRKHYQLRSDDWKYDVMPELLDGHNVMDFVDPDIDARLAELEREEEELEVIIDFGEGDLDLGECIPAFLMIAILRIMF